MQDLIQLLVVVVLFWVAFAISWKLLYRTSKPHASTPSISFPTASSAPPSAAGTPSRTLPATLVPQPPLPLELQGALGGRDPQWVSLPEGASFWVCTVSGGEAKEVWQRFHDLHASTGWYPILLGENFPAEDYYGEPLSDEEIAQAVSRDAQSYLFTEEDGTPDEIWEEVTGGYEEIDPAVELESPFKGGYLGLVKAQQGFEVPARLGWWGAANADVAPGDHALVLAHWEKEYDAELVHLGPDTMGLRVHLPPQDPQRARHLALEQFQYCGDVLEQGHGSLPSLAAILPRSTYWDFWWD